jgi:predicted nuclease of predicted toxin-antitoxin system
VRILIDECVPARVEHAFPGHSVQTVGEAGWRSSQDPSLLAFAERSFDVFVTVDGSLSKQNDLRRFLLGFVIAAVPNNRLETFEAIYDELRTAVATVTAGETIVVRHPRGNRDGS